MKKLKSKIIYAIIFSLLIVASAWFCDASEIVDRVAFSPSTDCEDMIIKLINGSSDKIDIAVYSINNDNIVNALKKAHDKGVKLRILTDKTQASGKSSKVFELYKHGIDIKVHTKHKIEHNKFAIFDGKYATNGSYNWTNPASAKNSENCVFFVSNKEIIRDFTSRFEYLWSVNKKEKSDEWIKKKLN